MHSLKSWPRALAAAAGLVLVLASSNGLADMAPFGPRECSTLVQSSMGDSCEACPAVSKIDGNGSATYDIDPACAAGMLQKGLTRRCIERSRAAYEDVYCSGGTKPRVTLDAYQKSLPSVTPLDIVFLVVLTAITLLLGGGVFVVMRGLLKDERA